MNKRPHNYMIDTFLILIDMIFFRILLYKKEIMKVNLLFSLDYKFFLVTRAGYKNYEI